MSFVLRWVGMSGTEYYCRGEDEDRFTTSQKKATRFASAVEARAEEPAFTYVGAGGPKDETGWKVLRLVKKVKA